MRCRTIHLAISVSNELEKISPFLTADLEACPAPLPVMASGGDNNKHPWEGTPTTMAASRRPIKHGWVPPPVGPRHQPGGVLRHTGACLSLLLVVTLVSTY
jgi:hypothetical protein